MQSVLMGLFREPSFWSRPCSSHVKLLSKLNLWFLLLTSSILVLTTWFYFGLTCVKSVLGVAHGELRWCATTDTPSENASSWEDE